MAARYMSYTSCDSCKPIAPRATKKAIMNDSQHPEVVVITGASAAMVGWALAQRDHHERTRREEFLTQARRYVERLLPT